MVTGFIERKIPSSSFENLPSPTFVTVDTHSLMILQKSYSVNFKFNNFYLDLHSCLLDSIEIFEKRNYRNNFKFCKCNFEIQLLTGCESKIKNRKNI